MSYSYIIMKLESSNCITFCCIRCLNIPILEFNICSNVLILEFNTCCHYLNFDGELNGFFLVSLVRLSVSGNDSNLIASDLFVSV